MNYSQSNNKKRMRRHRSPGKKLKNKLAYIIFRVMVSAVLIAAFAVTGAGIGAYLSMIQGAPPLSALSVDLLEGSSDTFIFDRHGNEIARLDGGTNRIFAAWEDISPYLKDAFVAIEDERFFEHNGVSAPDLVRAVYRTLMHGDTQGASTITQQVVKMDLGLMRNTIETKLQEQYLAIQYEAYLIELLGSQDAAKERILHRYLNMVPLGHGQYGVEAAAWRYFNKPASEVTLSEAVVIAAITSNPTQRSPIRFPDWNRYRAVHTLDNMLRLGMITEAQHREAYNDDVYARIQAVSAQYFADETIWPNFVDAIIVQVRQDLMELLDITFHEAQTMLFHAGLEIHTTMDPVAQRILDDAFLNEELFPTNPQDFEYYLTFDISVRNQLTNQVRHLHTNSDVWGRRVTGRYMFDEFVQWAERTLMGFDDAEIARAFHFTPQPQSAMTVIDHSNGHVIAMAGQRGEKQTNRSTNRAIESERQPGSVFKMFAAYAPAFDMGLITAATGFDDTPFIITDNQGTRVWPENWHRSFRGFNHVRRSIEQSYNVIAVKVIDAVGPRNAYNYLLNFGFTTIGESEMDNLSLALGGLTTGVTNIELTAAQGAIANGGILHQPILYTRVYDRNGEILIDNTNLEPTQVLNRNSAYLLIDTMRGVLTGRGTGPTAAFHTIAMDATGKTGTTQQGRDLYFTGSTPHLSASVWIGHDQPKPLTTNVTGGGNRPDTRIWRYVMEQIHIELDLPHRTFERPTGFTNHTVCATSGYLPGPNCPTRGELFAPGTVPNRPCHIHVSYQVCAVTGMMANQWCPPRSGVGILRDRSWMEVAGDVSLPDSGQEVPRTVREGIICTVHNQFNAGNVDYSLIDFDSLDLDDPYLADIINELLQGDNNEPDYSEDNQYPVPDGEQTIPGTNIIDPNPIIPGTNIIDPNQPPAPTPTPTPMPERTPIALPPEPTPVPTQAPIIGTSPDQGLPPPGNPGTPPPGPIIGAP